MPHPRVLEGPEAIAQGVRALSDARPVAFPTETVYGLGADATRDDAVRAVFELKGRPSHNPLIVHAADSEMARQACAAWPDDAQRLADALWPGPLTLVLPKSDTIPSSVTAGGPTVAVRCPDHPVALALIEAFGSPIVGPSANPSGRLSPTTADHVAAAFAGHDLVVIDGGPCRAGIESTVLDLTRDPPAILRPGLITADRIAEVLGRAPLAPAPGRHDPIARSPGVLGPHYQPTTQLCLHETASTPASDEIAIAHSIPPSDRVIAIASDPRGYAAGLYAALHDADRAAIALGAARILIELPAPADNPEDKAVRDAVLERLGRASA